MQQRIMPWHIWLMGALLSVLGSRWPALSAYLAYRIWFSSPRYKPSKLESIWEEQAEVITQVIAGKKLVSYHWGESKPGYVLLIHGWSGRGLQMGCFAEPLMQQGLGVISFDAPGHGASEGYQTNIIELANAVHELVKSYGQPRAIIAHSFGCMVAALAIREHQIPIEKLVTISCPTETRYLIKGFARYFKLNQKVLSHFNAKLFNQFGEDIFERTAADQNIKIAGVKLMVVHDKDDQIVSWRQSEKLADRVPGATTYYTSKLGHLRLLRDQDLIKQVMEFINNK